VEDLSGDYFVPRGAPAVRVKAEERACLDLAERSGEAGSGENRSKRRLEGDREPPGLGHVSGDVVSSLHEMS
jgi:hypothetical protein